MNLRLNATKPLSVWCRFCVREILVQGGHEAGGHHVDQAVPKHLVNRKDGVIEVQEKVIDDSSSDGNVADYRTYRRCQAKGISRIRQRPMSGTIMVPMGCVHAGGLV